MSCFGPECGSAGLMFMGETSNGHCLPAGAGGWWFSVAHYRGSEGTHGLPLSGGVCFF